MFSVPQLLSQIIFFLIILTPPLVEACSHLWCCENLSNDFDLIHRVRNTVLRYRDTHQLMLTSEMHL